MMIRGLLMDADDDVVTLLADAAAGQTVQIVSGRAIAIHPSLTVREDIPVYHKVAFHRIACGDPVRKYGEVIGVALSDIECGGLVSVHNIRSVKTRADG